MRYGATVGVFFSLLLSMGACVGDDATPMNSGGNDASADDATASDATTGDDGGSPGGDGAVTDADSPGDTCTPSCKTADVLLGCDGKEYPCAFGCSSETKACRSFDPVGPVSPSDLAPHPGEADVDLPATPEPVIVDTTNGKITHLSDTIRTANENPNVAQTLGGITFERRGGIGIFRARNWTLRNVLVRGDVAVGFVATTDVKVLGHVSTVCGTAGGAASQATQAGNGGSAQSDGSGGASGAGGGGHGSAGGKGADAIGDDDAPLNGGNAGPVFTFDPSNLRGGGRGGSGGNPAGAGVIVIAAGASTKIGDGTTVNYKPGASTFAVPKGIHVGGCGGAGGRVTGSATQSGGSGGGAGGLIVIASPIVLIDANAGLAANGGGGGGTDGPGRDAALDNVPALGGTYYIGGCTTGASGGKGAAGTTGAEVGSPNTPSCGEYTYGGGGGGGGGRILIYDKAGNVDDRAPTSILSPAAAVKVEALSADGT